MPTLSFTEGTTPTVGGDEDEWGAILNALFAVFDAAFQSLVENHNYAAASGVDTIAVTLDPAPSAYADGLRVRFKAAGANTIGPTLNVNGLGAKTLKYSDGSAIPAGGLVSGVIYTADYNGTEFIVAVSAGPASPAETLAGALLTKFLTPGGFAGNALLAANGYFRFPGGFTVMWGNDATSVTGESTLAVSFPATFSNACVFAVMIPNNPGASSGNDGFFQLVSKTTSGASFRAQDVGGTLAGGNWMALGY